MPSEINCAQCFADPAFLRVCRAELGQLTGGARVLWEEGASPGRHLRTETPSASGHRVRAQLSCLVARDSVQSPTAAFPSALEFLKMKNLDLPVSEKLALGPGVRRRRKIQFWVQRCGDGGVRGRT